MATRRDIRKDELLKKLIEKRKRRICQKSERIRERITGKRNKNKGKVSKRIKSSASQCVLKRPNLLYVEVNIRNKYVIKLHWEKNYHKKNR